MHNCLKLLIFTLALLHIALPHTASADGGFCAAGHNAYLLENYDDALVEYTACIEDEPAFPDNYIFRAETYRELGDRDAALADYAKGITLDESDAWAYYMRASAYAFWRDFDLALEDFSTALSIDDEYVAAYQERGLVYLDTGQYEQAIDDFTASLDLEPDDSIAYYNRGLAYDHLNRYTPALEDYTRSIELDPSYADAFAARGQLYYDRGYRDQGLEDLRKAVELPADDRYSRYNRGLAFARLEDYASAVIDFTFSIEAYPYDPDYFSARGDAYWELDQKDEAIADYRAYERLTGRLRDYMTARIGSDSSNTKVGPLLVLILLGGALGVLYLRYGHRLRG